jgi:hypothetical protein
MYPEEPLSLIQTAVDRTTREGTVLGESESITVERALKALTIDGAWQLGMEDSLGSIEPGKYADLVILDRNPKSTPISEIRSIKVLGSFVSGTQISGQPYFE